MDDTRLIERWLPIAEIGIESLRERRSLSALPPTYYLHVWWARRPLVASRSAILASLLPADADRRQFMHSLGIHGDPVAASQRIALADRTGARLGSDAYGYLRAFAWSLDEQDRAWLDTFGDRLKHGSVLDPTAGGGSIPFEAVRLGLPTYANDLNPVAALIEYATVKWPAELGATLISEYANIAEQFKIEVKKRLLDAFPREPEEDCRADGYLWARTIRCPYCEGLVPLSPNWRLAPNGTGVQLIPHLGPDAASRRCTFKIVRNVAEQSLGTVADGDATCPFSDCARVIDGDEVKRQASAGDMAEQLFTVVFKRKIVTKGKNGKHSTKWVRGYRSPEVSDDNHEAILAQLAEKLPAWEALDLMPTEHIDDLSNYDRGHRLYGILKWSDMFSARQLLSNGTSVEVFAELLDAEQKKGPLTEIKRAAFVYLSFSLDKLLNWNARAASWNVQHERLRSVFEKHNFEFKWSFAEMALLVEGIGFDWAINQTYKCIEELVDLIRPGENFAKDSSEFVFSPRTWNSPPITMSCRSGDALDHVADDTIDCVVMDPPYYDNVMYAELSDFFYVWLKRTAGRVVPELFRRSLTDKENEAVANVAKFRDQKGAKGRAGRDYQDRMAAIFSECRRVLKPDGIMTLMFTHKATGAWDALTKGLIEAEFRITASWPINTEFEHSMHIKNKAAASSTIFLVCRPRVKVTAEVDIQYWEDVEPLVAQAVRKRVTEFQAGGIRGVDLYLASFGPALEEFSRHWPLKRGTPKPEPRARRKAQRDLFPEPWDPYEASPEDALDVARREVKSWRLEQLTHKKAQIELDARTAWFVLAWDAFEAPVFPYDEALRLARAVGADLDADLVGSLCEKKGSDLLLWDSAQRAAKSVLGAPDGARGMIDALHHAAHQARTRSLEAGRELLERAGLLNDGNFSTALQAVLEVLPVGTAFSGIDLPGDVAGAGNDFEVLEKLRRLAFSERVEEPKQLELWKREGDAEKS